MELSSKADKVYERRTSMKKKSRLKVYKEHWPLYLMMVPGLLYLLINNYIPMAGIVIAFVRYTKKDIA